MRTEGDEIEKGGTNRSVMVNDQDRQCLPMEERDESVAMKVLPSPNPPSRQEMLEHNLTHGLSGAGARTVLLGRPRPRSTAAREPRVKAKCLSLAWTMLSWATKTRSTQLRMLRMSRII